MRIHAKILRLAIIASTLCLNSCVGLGVFSSPLYLAVTISPRPVSLAQGGSTVILTASVSNNLSLPTWSLLDAGDAANAGTLTPVNANSPNSVLYTAPPSPPVYNSAVAAGFAQGTVTVQATVNPPAGSTLPVAHDSVTFFITAPTVTVSLFPATVGVPVNGGFELFNGYELGSANNALTWKVNGAIGGSATYGTIDKNGVYTAPASVPVTGNMVTVTVTSQADPNQIGTAVVTLLPS